MQKALEKRSLREENQQLWQSLSEQSLSMVGNSPEMRGRPRDGREGGRSRSTVLITGESGTGKELVARAIHLAQPTGRPALPSGQLRRAGRGRARERAVRPREGRLHRGRHRARRDSWCRPGRARCFLDEIGEMLPATQVKLLRVLQERKVKPVGSTARGALRRADGGGDQQATRRRGEGRPLPRRPLLPAERDHHRAAAAATSAGRDIPELAAVLPRPAGGGAGAARDCASRPRR